MKVSAHTRRYHATLLGTTALVGIAFSAALVFPTPAMCAPKGGMVVAGSASIATVGNTTNIVTSTNRTIIDWQEFSLNTNEISNFVQNGNRSAVLNRVTGQDPSVLLGALSSNGQVYLINPNGVLIGGGARIDTAGFVASTLDLSDADFLAGKYERFSGTSTASVANLGAIDAQGGSVFLIGAQVANAGTIAAPDGTVGLAAGFHVVLKEAGSEHLYVQANLPGEGSVGGAGAANSGAIQAAAAEIIAAGGNMYALAINNTGLIRATAVAHGPDGSIQLVAGAGGSIATSGSLVARRADGSGGSVTVDSGDGGTTAVAGTIDASGKSGSGTKGGDVTVLGGRIAILDGTHIDASGDGGGGAVLIGGALHGADASKVRHASETYVAPTASIDADARVEGDGGEVVVWSDRYTDFNGNISARGGALGGDGGQVEVSSHGLLAFDGAADLRAPHGARGTLLLDPQDIEIDDAPATDNIASTSTTVAAASFNATPGAQSVFVPTGQGSASILTTATLDAELALGDVTVATVGDAHPGAGDITVNGT
ncbi:MAG TPA: filamentous hemagglutinin N-terminal domain-containing protein, partial [Alphaproteobacteria bacterium]|nr:filamentous hemagglutinin N-terminal domain-containing protein [Alphaproteobacteria bacterium]